MDMVEMVIDVAQKQGENRNSYKSHKDQWNTIKGSVCAHQSQVPYEYKYLSKPLLPNSWIVYSAHTDYQNLYYKLLNST